MAALAADLGVIPTHDVMRCARMITRGPFGIVSFLTLLAGGCAAPLPETHQSVAARDPDQVRAVAIIETYRQATAGRRDNPDLCIGVEPGVDLSKVLKAVAGRGPRIWAIDRCTLREGGMVEALSGRPAIQVSVESVQMADSGLAYAKAGWMYGALAGEGREFTLEFRLGTWTVVASKPTWVS
jgi:hypothetical protein